MRKKLLFEGKYEWNINYAVVVEEKSQMKL